ncbi:MAG: hypothetical protein OHK0039_00610 [Bacteroidia bacterium]
MMTPFPEREHSETLEQGDAKLLPEFIDLGELGVVGNFGDNMVFATAYYRRVQHVINRVNTVFNDSVLNRIYTNAGTAQAAGIELGAALYPTPWWKVYVGGNAYIYTIRGSLLGDSIDQRSPIYSLTATMDLRIRPDLDVQVGFNYLSARITAQGVDSRFYNPNLTLRKTFLDGRFTLSAQWINIDMSLLQSNEQRITTQRLAFFTTTNYIYEVDMVMLSLSYRFNQPASQLKCIRSEFGDKEY